MKKTILIAFFLGCLTTFASAGVKVGVTLSGYELDAVGKESNGGGAADQSRSETIEGVTGSIFAEFSHDMMMGVAIGLDIVPYDIDMGAAENRRIGDTLGNQNNQTGVNTVDVVMSEIRTAYILVPMPETGLYLKAGYSEAELGITETILTGTSYPNADINAWHLNIGYEADVGPIFVRGEVGHSEWESVTVKSSSGRTSYTADLDGMSARISIGKAF